MNIRERLAKDGLEIAAALKAWPPLLRVPAHKRRVQLILEARLAGLTLQEIGKALGISRSRVEQLQKYGHRAWRTAKQQAAVDARKQQFESRALTFNQVFQDG